MAGSRTRWITAHSLAGLSSDTHLKLFLSFTAMLRVVRGACERPELNHNISWSYSWPIYPNNFSQFGIRSTAVVLGFCLSHIDFDQSSLNSPFLSHSPFLSMLDYLITARFKL